MRRLVLPALALLVGCQRETTPPLIQVTELSPHEIEQGDHLALAGVGFPEGKLAHVSFRGDLHRAGVAAVRGVEVDVEAVVAASNEIDIPFNDALQALFVGAGDRAAHTTFTGEVTVAFAALSPGAPPVAGTLRDAWLDVRPPVASRAADEAQQKEGQKTLAFMGIKPGTPAPASGGILVESLDRGGPAEAARFLPGDVVTEIDGLRVLSARDMVLPDGARAATLKIRRDGSPREEQAQVSLIGLSPRPAAALLAPVVVLGLAALLLALLLGPTPLAVAWLQQRIASRVRAGDHRRLPSINVAGSVIAGATATFAAMALGHAFAFADLDVGLLFLMALTARITTLLLAGSPTPDEPRRRLWRGDALRRVVAGIASGLPAAIALACVVMLSGSLRLEDIVRVQAGWPWGWTLFRCPVSLALAGVFLASVVAEHRVRHRFFAFTEWANLFLMCGLAAALFLGGWSIPGVAPEQMEGRLGLELLGCAVFAIKAWLVVGLVLAVRWTLPRASVDEMTAWSCKWLLPASAISLLLTAAWVRAVPSVATERLVGVVTLVSLAAVALHFAAQVRGGLLAKVPPAELPVSPFL